MNTFIIASFWIFIVSIYGDLNGIDQNFKIDTNGFNQIDFLPSIRIRKNTAMKELVYKIDGNQNHNDKILTSHIAKTIKWNEGVLHSNGKLILNAPMILKLNDDVSLDDTTTTTTLDPAATTTTSDPTTTTTISDPTTTTTISDPTTRTTTSDPTTTTLDPAAMTTTSDLTTTTTASEATNSTTTTSDIVTNTGSSDETGTTLSVTTLGAFPTGEPPPTHSAKLGMGLGITFISFLIIGEIVYFKCFYRGGLSHDEYVA